MDRVANHKWSFRGWASHRECQPRLDAVRHPRQQVVETKLVTFRIDLFSEEKSLTLGRVLCDCAVSVAVFFSYFGFCWRTYRARSLLLE